ncbi:hypothetical protein Trydic_g10117, partial [Trypoxylus dichotomus]
DVPTPGKRRPSASPQLPHPAKVKRGIAHAIQPPTTSRADPIETSLPELTIPPTPPHPPSIPVLTPVPKTPSPPSTVPSINLVTPPPPHTDMTHSSNRGNTIQPKRKRETDSFSPSNIRKRTVTFHESPPKPEEEVRDLPVGPPPRRSLSASDILALGEPLLEIPAELQELPFLDHLLQSRNGADDNTKALISAGLTASLDALDAAITTWLEMAFPTATRRRMRGYRDRKPRPAPPANNQQKRVAAFKKAQDLYSKDPKRLASLIIKGEPLMQEEVLPDLPSIEAYYAGLFEVTPPCARFCVHNTKDAGDGAIPPQAPTGSPSPRRYTPTAFRASRTVLLPKTGNPRELANWRPITISSAVQRLFHRILAKRFATAVDLHPLQRGFTELDGTLANTVLLDTYIKSRRVQGKTFHVISLDVRKAFDTVSHQAIRHALGRCGIPSALQDYIASTYDGAFTNIEAGGNRTRRIRFMRGVKQGDPLSPILFNMVLDEVLEELNAQPHGGTLPSGDKVAAVAFADDVLLLQDEDVHVPEALDTVLRFFRARGMAINSNKCSAMAATSTQGKTVPRTKSIFKINNSFIPSVQHMNTLKYLGLHFGVAGAEKPSIHNLVGWISNLHSAPLKPDQKLTMLKRHIIPRLLYGLQSPAITSHHLQEADRVIRRAAKRILHLSSRTGSQFLHAAIGDGGLGIPQLRYQVPDILKRRLDGLISKDEYMGRLFRAKGTAVDFYKRVHRLAAQGPPRAYWREQVTTRPLSQGLQACEEDAASRQWLQRIPPGWTGRDFVRAVQLRTGNLPTIGLPYNPPEMSRCRAGCPKRETLSHVLQGCPATHFERIKRHDEVVNKVAAHCRRKGWTTEVEPRIRHPDGQLFIPDLAVHLPGSSIVVCDVQVCWEGQRTLAESWHRKKLVYDHPRFHDAAKRRWTGSTIAVVPLLLGARGVWPRCNQETERLLQLSKHLKGSCVQSCLKWGSTIHRIFMASVWRQAPRPALNHQPRPPE